MQSVGFCQFLIKIVTDKYRVNTLYNASCLLNILQRDNNDPKMVSRSKLVKEQTVE